MSHDPEDDYGNEDSFDYVDEDDYAWDDIEDVCDAIDDLDDPE